MPFVGMERSAAKKERDVATKSNPAFKQLRSCKQNLIKFSVQATTRW